MTTIPLINREKSILAFQERVFQQANNDQIPLLERIKFISIVSSNLDEFFEVRFANIKERIFSGVSSIDGQPVDEWSADIKATVAGLVEKQHQLYQSQFLSQLSEIVDVSILSKEKWTTSEREWLFIYFKEVVRPVITPIALDIAHPFPHIYNKTLNFIIELEGNDAYGREIDIAILPIPKNLPSLVKLPSIEDGHRFVFLSEVISEFIAEIFQGLVVKDYYEFRLTRNGHLFIDEEELTNLHQILQGELHQRNFGHAVRLEIEASCPDGLIQFLLNQFDLTDIDLYKIPGIIDLTRLNGLLVALKAKKELFYDEFVPRVHKKWQVTEDYFSLIREQDIYLHHPFDGFSPIVDLLTAAADDPKVQVIRMTVYRTGDDSVLMEQLVRAAQNGKEVNVIFELMARFDEATNLTWASILEEAGVKVVYGVFGYKTHAKMLLIVRNESSQQQRMQLKYYTHVSTGNYHSGTARFYTDMALLTSNPNIAKDVSDIFLSLGSLGKAPKLRCLWQAPFNLYDQLVLKIDKEIEEARLGNKAYVVGKMNALLEQRIIKKLYEASQAGVKIDLIVRGACSLRPGVKGLSENITVRSIVGQFLEHSRIYYFYNEGNEDLYIASADWMNRNFFRRIEVSVPINDKIIKARIIKEGLLMYLQDNVDAWELDGNTGIYSLISNDAPLFSAQQELLRTRCQ